MTLPKDCILTWEIDAGDSILSEQRRVGPHRNDFFERYTSAAIDPLTQRPVDAVSRFRLAEQPIFWLTADKRDVVVDLRFSGDLVAVDVPRLRGGESRSLGLLSAHARAMPARDVLELLVRADVLRTYWHIGSEVCLVRERADAGAYRAELRGEHTYFTSGRNRETFSFVFEIAAGGEMSVTSPDP